MGFFQRLFSRKAPHRRGDVRAAVIFTCEWEERLKQALDEALFDLVKAHPGELVVVTFEIHPSIFNAMIPLSSVILPILTT